MYRLISSALAGVLMVASAAPAQYAPEPAAPYPGTAEQLVDGWYSHFLNRQRDRYTATWIDALRQGQAPESVLASILSSQEYYDKGGSTPQGFIQTLFQDVVGHPPGQQQLGYWMNRLNQGGDRADVAHALLVRHPQAWQGGAPAPSNYYNQSESSGYYSPPAQYHPQPPRYEYQRPAYRYRR